MVVGWTLAVTAARAIRTPNDFSEAHWLLDYRFGFIKRGLIGSLCSSVGRIFDAELTAGAILWLSAAAFCVMAMAMLAILSRSWVRHPSKRDVLALGLVFASSPFFVSNAHLLGYFDALLYTAAVVSVALVLSDRPLPAAFVSAAAILSHEGYLLVGFPVVCLASVATATAVVTGARSRPGRWKAHAVALSIPLLVFAGVATHVRPENDRLILRQQLMAHLDAAGFVPTMSENVARDETTSLAELLPENLALFDDRLRHAASLKAVAPPLIALAGLLFAAFRIRVFSMLSAVVAGVICAPLLMHAIAWDTARIWTYSLGSAVIAYWVLTETRPARAVPVAWVLCAIAAVIVNAFTRMPLMDGQVERFSDLTRVLFYTPAIIVLLAHLRPQERRLVATAPGAGPRAVP